MKIEREDLLRGLEVVEPGLSKTEILEQSSCFAFVNGAVMTYDGEVFCKAPNPLGKDFSGAVAGRPLLSLLRQYPEKVIDVEMEDKYLIIRGRNRQTEIRRQAEVHLPIEKVTKPKDWKKLHADFPTAVRLAQDCVEKKDQSDTIKTCVHVTAKCVEASDLKQAFRFSVKTPLEQEFLVRGASVKHAAALDVTEFCEAEGWVHFRSPAGVRIACRRWVEQYLDLTPKFQVEGKSIQFPKTLVQAAKKAQEFSREDQDNNQVKVELRPGRLRISGTGQSGRHVEAKKVTYKGPPLTFMVSPDVLSAVVERYDECVVSQNRIKVEGGKFVYVAALAVVAPKVQ